jgi:hypothetical protein
MKKTKKTKAPTGETALDRIVAQLHAALRRETTNIVEIGNLLIESRKLLANEHGEWLPWLEENSTSAYALPNATSPPPNTSRGKCDTACCISAIYRRPFSMGWPEAITCQKRKRRYSQRPARAASIRILPSTFCDALKPPPDEPDDADKVVEAEAAEDAEIAAILDGPPPDVPPPAPNTTPDFTLRAFDQAANALKQLMTKPAARFASTAHTSGDLQGVATFIHAVADWLRETSDESPVPAAEGAR